MERKIKRHETKCNDNAGCKYDKKLETVCAKANLKQISTAKSTWTVKNKRKKINPNGPRDSR